MKNICMGFTLLTLVSCGSSSNGSEGLENRESPYQESTVLSREERVLINDLVQKHAHTQHELVKLILGHQKLDRGTLSKIDQYINVECIQSSGLCYVNKKD
ncbi:MAG TPA: hypothetical protein VNJ01_13905 [Bacteriovoracaceae bacterium]|nr:hypothetical protein [Bacteriovoracaceae bacterium]